MLHTWLPDNTIKLRFRDIFDDLGVAVLTHDENAKTLRLGPGYSILDENGSPLGAGGGGGSSEVLKSTTVLTNAQVLVLPTTPIEIIAAPGANRIIFPQSVFMRMNWVADYTNIDPTSVISISNGVTSLLGSLDESIGAGVSGLLAGGGPDGTSALVGPRQPISGGYNHGFAGIYDSDAANLALSIKASNAMLGDFTGGNAGNTLTVTVLYTVVDF